MFTALDNAGGASVVVLSAVVSDQGSAPLARLWALATIAHRITGIEC